MPFDLWLTFLAAATLILIIPGPTILLVLSYALSHGRAVAVATALGVAMGDLIAMSLSLLGLGALILTSATAFSLVKWAGAAYLIWLGIKMLRSAGEIQTAPADPQSAAKAPAADHRRIFAHAAAVTALNPKSIGFFIAFVPQFLTSTAPLAPQAAILIATFVSLAALNALAYAFLADRLRAQISRPALLRGLTRAGGATLIAMGAMTASLKKAT
ncbi:MAG: LysE family translocator [Mangrovicoccus sp.]|nr:LysE family translocator [Mangrovicoccus sp.]